MVAIVRVRGVVRAFERATGGAWAGDICAGNVCAVWRVRSAAVAVATGGRVSRGATATGGTNKLFLNDARRVVDAFERM